ncbi:hypothetical protein FXO38_19382 [Capsicum annuum]|nr:hypothetical protein FXO38_19382 [Capsicum annuum]
MFKAIGDHCGGWLEIEEETSLKNHLKRERMRIKEDGKEVPKEVKIVDNGLTFLIPIWSESRTMVVAREEEVLQVKNHWAKKSYTVKENGFCFDRETRGFFRAGTYFK